MDIKKLKQITNQVKKSFDNWDFNYFLIIRTVFISVP